MPETIALRKRYNGKPPERIIPVKKLIQYLVHEIGERQDLIEIKEVHGGVNTRFEHEIDTLHDVLTWVNYNGGIRDIVAPGYKTCSKCKFTLSLNVFGNDKYSWDGHNNQCKRCRSVKKS
jgi:hypothetical protein